MKTVPLVLMQRVISAPVWLRRDHLNNKLLHAQVELEQLYKDLVVCVKVGMKALHILLVNNVLHEEI
jgi:hypothetical protein